MLRGILGPSFQFSGHYPHANKSLDLFSGSYELSLQDLAESHRLDPDFQSTNDALHQALLDRNAWKAAISSPQNPTEQKISPQ